MKKMTNIIVGCGGSGAKIAVQMAKLMGQDPAWRHEMDENIYFLLFDTDRGDLEKYVAELEDPGITAPNVHVTSLLTTNGYQLVGEIIDDLSSGMIHDNPDHKRKALERFGKRWWLRNGKNATDLESAVPFTAPGVKKITSGAAQVPCVSYVASWISMKPGIKKQNSIETSIESLCKKISENKAGIDYGGDNPLGEFNIFYLGSLAGGTGRGALIPVAFKLKEVFYKQFGRIPFISAYLMDQSCFEANREPHNALPQMMNSMTGWSEISSWVSYYDEETSGKVKKTNYGYSLPGITNMHDADHDVLSSLLSDSKIADADKKSDYGLDRARLPFDAVGVIGNRSAANFEATSPEQIYGMVSAALYVRLSQSLIDSKISNEGRTYFSVGTSITEVPQERIKKFFENQARYDIVERFVSKTKKEEIEDAAVSLISKLGFANPLSDFLNHDTSLEVKNSMQAFAQRCFEPGGLFENRLSDLRTALTSQTPPEAERLVAELLGETALEDNKFLDETAKCFLDSYCSYSLKNDGEHVLADEKAIVAYALSQAIHILDTKGSAADVEQFCIIASNQLRVFRPGDSSVLSRNGIEGWFAQTGLRFPNSSEILEKAKNREGFLGLGGVYFSDDEIAQVMSEAKRELAIATLRALGKALNLPAESNKPGLGLLNLIIAQLEDAGSRARFLCRCASVVKDRMNVNIEGLADERKNLFMSEDLTSDISDGAAMYIRREIRPAFPSPEELILETGKSKFAQSVILGIDHKSGQLYEYSEKEKTDPFDKETWLVQLEKDFKSATYKAVFSDGSVRDVIQKFRLTEVVRSLTKWWRKALQELWDHGNRDDYYKKAQVFRNFFGIEPKLVGSNVEISGGEDGYREAAGDDFLLLGLACASVRTCRAFWKTTHGAEQAPHLIVQVPVSIENSKQQSWKEMMKKSSNLQIQGEHIQLLANTTAGSTKEHNPFILVVYTSTGASNLNEVTTLDTWQKNPTLLQALRLAEDLDGKCQMPFNDKINEIWNGYRGSGFTDPSYIYQPELRRNRWRPWVPKEEQETQNQQDDGSKLAFQAIYATLGPKWYLEAALGVEQANAILAASNLSGDPVFAEGERKMYKLGRLPMCIRAGKASVSDADIRIQIGSNVTQSIRTLPEVLSGKREAKSARGTGAEHLVELGKSVEHEYNDFFGTFAESQGFDSATAKASHLKMIQKLKDYIIQERQNSNPNQEDGDREFWQTSLTAISKKIDELGG